MLKVKISQLKIDVVVFIQRSYDKEPFIARITEVTSEGDDKTIITFERTDGEVEENPSCHADFVTQVLTAATEEACC